MSFLPSVVEDLPVVYIKTNDSEASLPIHTAFDTLRPDLEGCIGRTIRVTLDPAYMLYSAQKLVDVLEILKLRDIGMVSPDARRFIFGNLKAICNICNDGICDFCKSLVTCASEVLTILRKLGDDGNYKWIPSSLVQDLFFLMKKTTTPPKFVRSEPKEAAYDDLSPQFFKFVYLNAPISFVPMSDGVSGYSIAIQHKRKRC